MARKGTSPQKRQDALIALAVARRGGGSGGISSVTGASPIVANTVAGHVTVSAPTYGPAPNVLIYEPGGTASGNVFTTFAALKAVADTLATAGQPIRIFLVGIHASGICALPAGAWNFTNPDVVIEGPFDLPLGVILECAIGATLSGVGRFQNLGIQLDDPTVPLLTYSSGTHFVNFNEVFLTTTAGAPLVKSETGANVGVSLNDGSNLGDGTHAVFACDATSQLNVSASDDSVLNGPTAWNNAVGATVSFNVFDVAVVNGASGQVPSTLFTIAADLGYDDSLVAPPLGASQVQAAIDALKGGAGGPLLVLQPGGTAGGRIFTTWAAVVTARNAIEGPASIYFDVTANGGAAIHLSSSAAFADPTTFLAAFDPNNAGTFTEIIIDAGVTLSNNVESWANLLVVNNSTAAVITYAAQTNLRTVRFQDCEILSLAAAPFLSATGGTSLQVFGYDGSIFGDGTHGPLFERDAASTIHLSIQDTSQLLNSTLSGAGGPGTFEVDYVASATIGTALGAAATLTQDSLASQTLYDDALVAPALGATTVQAAIDDLKQGKPLATWTDEAAGAAVAVAAQSAPQFFQQDTNAAATPGTYTFPAHGTAIDGQEVTIALTGAAVTTSVNLAPGANNAMGDPNDAGQFGASGATLNAANAGQVIKRKYKDLGSSGQWRPF